MSLIAHRTFHSYVLIAAVKPKPAPREGKMWRKIICALQLIPIIAPNHGGTERGRRVNERHKTGGGGSGGPLGDRPPFVDAKFNRPGCGIESP